ncbi:hypothetical protein H0H92_010113, partial [Tricholoma furcatifolium]
MDDPIEKLADPDFELTDSDDETSFNIAFALIDSHGNEEVDDDEKEEEEEDLEQNSAHQTVGVDTA